MGSNMLRDSHSQSTPRAVLGALVAICALLAAGSARATDAKTFSTPESAAQALIAAAQSGDKQAILDILGSDAKDLIFSGDEVQDKEAAEKFVTSAQQKMHLEQTDEGAEVMNIGNDDWPFPIPIVKKGNVWAFDTLAGKQELLDRRIGANELGAIEVSRTFVDAQR